MKCEMDIQEFICTMLHGQCMVLKLSRDDAGLGKGRYRLWVQALAFALWPLLGAQGPRWMGGRV